MRRFAALLLLVGAAQASPTLIFEGSEPLDLGDTVPDVVAPSIGTGTCMGVVSGAAAISGIGFAGGTSVTDEECQIRYNSVRLDELGQKDAAVQIMCLIPSAHKALAVAGYVCMIGDDVRKSEDKRTGYERLMEN